MRILVVEDQKDLNDIIVRKLTNEHYSVDACYTGDEPRDFIRCAEYDAIIAALNQSGYRGKLILQEFIPGGDDAMRVMNTYSDNEGRVRFQCLGQPVLEEYSPATLGNYAAIISRSDEALYQKIADFLNAIGYVGFADFDMKYDSRTGRYLLFEINGRPG
jgi:D-aspartate ligase